MAERIRWQYCQIEVGANSIGVLRQFFPDRLPIETELHQTWPSMIAKLGEQGWEMVSAFPNEGGRGRSPLTYVFKRDFPGGATPILPQVQPEPPRGPQPPQFDPLDL